ncbi:class E sortase [Blastococcus brunescens]|uniref:Class E sortase n=1 Tax=Blastococcus brunescens TaxID=1564165 RepID=A0ABZ1AZI5_9ACTN|nr:class E sortase [Blastococcus sp. BMG 8361]WRL63884.1 class E sortase [Blastococcus sp. BMG 8361]
MSSAVDLEAPPRETGPDAEPRRRGDWLRALVRGVGQTLITFGLVALLFVVYELYVTDILAAQEQDQLSQQIQEQWADLPPADAPTVTPPEGAPAPGPAPAPAPAPAPESIDAGLGDPFAVLHIPRLGEDYERVVVEGTAQVQLAQGPGHYLDTAMPGQDGNFAVAGHRIGRGSPFLDLDRMQPGDAIVVETASNWYVYRVLGDPATGDFGTDPSGVPGRQIVHPSQIDVIAPTPGGGDPSGAYLTLTTCHPKYSAAQRLVIHARLDGSPSARPRPPTGHPP